MLVRMGRVLSIAHLAFNINVFKIKIDHSHIENDIFFRGIRIFHLNRRDIADLLNRLIIKVETRAGKCVMYHITFTESLDFIIKSECLDFATVR